MFVSIKPVLSGSREGRKLLKTFLFYRNKVEKWLLGRMVGKVGGGWKRGTNSQLQNGQGLRSKCRGVANIVESSVLSN